MHLLCRFAGIAFTNKMMDPKPTFDGKFAFQKIYQELDYLAGGIMVIPPGGEKQTKPAKDNSYVRPFLSPSSYLQPILTRGCFSRSSMSFKVPSPSPSTEHASSLARSSPVPSFPPTFHRHPLSCLLYSGGTFFVPRGNHYAIEATSNREVRLFFAQGRRVIEFDNGETRPDTAEDSRQFASQEQEQQLGTVQEEEEEEPEEEEEEEE
jgi:centromere protein C